MDYILSNDKRQRQTHRQIGIDKEKDRQISLKSLIDDFSNSKIIGKPTCIPISIVICDYILKMSLLCNQIHADENTNFLVGVFCFL